MKRKLPLIVLAIAVLTVVTIKITNTPAEETTLQQAQPHVAGYMIHIDPATGQMTERAPGTTPLVIDPDLQNALSTSAEGLVELPSPIEGGGMIVDLQGRFQNTMISTIDEDGTLHAPCLSGLPDTSTSESGKTDDGGGER